MPLPVAHGLLGAALADLLLPEETPRRRLAAAAIGCLAVMPDLDLVAVWVWGVNRDWHRGFSHSFAFAVLIGALALLSRHPSRYRIMVSCSVAIASHGVLDAMATPAVVRGVQLFWPFSEWRARFGLIDLWTLSPDWIGPGEVGRAVYLSFLELLLLGPPIALWMLRRRPSRVEARLKC